MDYKKLGFKCGLEIHQQINSHKLFCKCPSLLDDSKKDISFTRKLKGIEGETGLLDKAAEYENLRDKDFIYQGWSGNSCLVEFDEEPPHNINKDALNVSLQVCKLLNCSIVDEAHVMRKTVVDGSNTSGFQRTVLIGFDGYLETSKGKVGISSVCLEEDSARKISENGKKTIYNLDRLGIPLIEIATNPDIKDPEHSKEVAEKLGMILRSTGKVKRGLGTIRQDVNVSIKKGNRVELKGFQDLKQMPIVIKNEIKRQLKGTKSEVRKVNSDNSSSFLRPMPGSARMYPETDVRNYNLRDLIENVKVPELMDEKIMRYVKNYDLSNELSRSLVKSGIDFESYLGYNIDKKLIANVLIEVPKELKKRFSLDYKFNDSDFMFIFDGLEKNKINKSDVIQVMLDISNSIYDLSKYEKVSDKEILKYLKSLNVKNLSTSAIMGDIMKKYGKSVDGKKASEIVKNLKQE